MSDLHRSVSWLTGHRLTHTFPDYGLRPRSSGCISFPKYLHVALAAYSYRDSLRLEQQAARTAFPVPVQIAGADSERADTLFWRIDQP